MKTVLTLLIPLTFLLAGCSSGSPEPSTGDSAAAKDNFSRPMTDAEKAKGGAGAAKGGAAPGNPNTSAAPPSGG